MPIWRCPHCGTPQAETARCWVCRRSSTTCSTCRQFRQSVAGQLGYCGLDRRRLPLAGTELRGCWEAAPQRSMEVPDQRVTAIDGDAAEPPSPALRLRDFVPVELNGHRIRPRPAARRPGGDPEPEPAAAPPSAPPLAVDRVTLFADGEV